MLNLAEQKTAAKVSMTTVKGLVTTNSVEFVEKVFSLYENDETVVFLRSVDDNTRILSAGASQVYCPGDTTGWADLTFTPKTSDAVSQILFTSGTTGEPKPIALSQANIADAVTRLISAQELDETVREYVGVPVAYSFGMGRCRAISAVGGRFYIPPNGFDLVEFISLLKAGEINALSAVPTLMRIVLQNSDLIAPHANKLKWIEIGSQPFSSEEKAALKTLFPNTIILQHYGLTEASRSTFLRIDQTSSEDLSSVGTATDGVEIRLDEQGCIEIRGRHVARWTLRDGDLVPLTNICGWFKTGDRGTLANNVLHFEGRVDDLINCSGIKLSSGAFETSLVESLGVPIELAISRLPDTLRGDGILVSYVLTENITLAQIETASIDTGYTLGVPAAAIKFQAVDTIPRTETSKVRRQALTDSYIEQLAPTPSPLAEQLLALWQHELGAENICLESDFVSLGGDTFSAQTLVTEMVKAGVSDEVAHTIFKGASISEIVRQTENPLTTTNDTETLLLNVWREALDREDIPTNLSFYDVGGDSLSAVKVALGMERAGLDPALALGIFDGRTIEQLGQDAREASSGEEGVKQRPRNKKTEVAALSEAANFLKGFVLLCMISSHWAPVYLARFGLKDSIVSNALAPFFSLGTPTLAFAFGLGVSIFYLRQHGNDIKSFKRNVRLSGILLGIGILVGGSAEIMSILVLNPESISFDSLLFYVDNPFVYYFLTAISLPLWIGVLRHSLGCVQFVLFAALASYGAHLGLHTLMADNTGSPLAHAFSKMIVGHWGLFQMFAITLMGVAFGLAVETIIRSGGKLAAFKYLGWLMFTCGIVMSAAFGEMATWFIFPKMINLSSAVLYSGLAIVTITTFPSLATFSFDKPWLRIPIEWICSIGVLLFPLYVAQSLVYHSATVLQASTGLGAITSLSLIIMAYLAIAYYPVRRIHRLYYGARV